jgi:hypothetical protein
MQRSESLFKAVHFMRTDVPAGWHLVASGTVALLPWLHLPRGVLSFSCKVGA